jgi:hypothetical protein
MGGFKFVLLNGYFFDYRFKGFRGAGSQLSQHLLVKHDLVFVEGIDQFAEGGAILAGGGINADSPEFLEVALFEAAVAVGVGISMQQGFFRGHEIRASAVLKALGAGEDVFASFVGGGSALYSCHGCWNLEVGI